MEEEVKERVLAMWQENKTSYQISAELGVSRNAVLGFIKRRRARGVALRGRLPVEKKPKAEKTRPVEQLFEPSEPPAGVSLAGLRHNSCRFIISEEEPPSYCGRTRTRGPYCSEHYALCYVAPRKVCRKKNKERDHS